MKSNTIVKLHMWLYSLFAR